MAARTLQGTLSPGAAGTVSARAGELDADEVWKLISEYSTGLHHHHVVEFVFLALWP